jgi:phosphoglycerol transferase MdoB-like AlkP superfamily enzyme
LGSFSVPIILFDPSGTLPVGVQSGIAQQIDIMPTILHLVGNDKPYVAFGKDLLITPSDDTWAVNFQNDIYQLIKGNYLIQFDGRETKAVYQFREDPLLEHNLLENNPQPELEKELKAIIQSYMQRMNEDGLIIKD